jgi:hypothetical protein
MLGNDVGEGLTIVEMIAVKAIRLGVRRRRRCGLGKEEVLGKVRFWGYKRSAVNRAFCQW